MFLIFEALYILALDDEEGDIVESAAGALESTLAGAVMAELVLKNRVSIKDKRIVVSDQTPTEHPILDKALFDVLDTGKNRKLRYWINTLTYKKLKDDIVNDLVKEGVLERKKKQLHLSTSDGKSRSGNGFSKYVLKNRLREIVMTGSQSELSEKVLLAFIYHGKLLKLVFTHGERKAAHKRLKEMIATEEEGSGLGETLDEIVAEACEFTR